MTHFGPHGSNRPTVSLGSYGISAPHNTIQSYQRPTSSDGAAVSRPTSFRTPHYGGVANIRDSTQRDRASKPRAHAALSDYGKQYSSMYLRQKMGYGNQGHLDRPSSRINDYPYGSDYGRPHSSLGHLAQESYCHKSGRTSDITPYSHAIKRPALSGYSKFHDDLGRFSSAASFRSNRPSDASYYRPSAPFQRVAKDSAKPYEPTGWRAKLSKEGYLFSPKGTPVEPAPDPEPYEIADDDESTVYEGFVICVCRGTSTFDDEEGEGSVYQISRRRRIKVPLRDKSTYHSSSAYVQVETDEIEALSVPQRSRGVGATRHRSWYHEGSYNRYVSPMPWRSSIYSKDSWRKSTRSESCAPHSNETCNNSEGIREDDGSCDFGDEIHRSQASGVEHRDCDLQGNKEITPEEEEVNKDFRKSVLNVDLPETEAAQFAKRQEETRRRDLQERRKKHLSLTSTVSGDGSPNETGYESHSSCSDTEGAVSSPSYMESRNANVLDRSSSPAELLGSNSCMRSIGDQVPDAPENVNCTRGSRPCSAPHSGLENLPSCSDGRCSCEGTKMLDDDEKFRCHREPAFRFRTINSEPSQRDSGFSELINRNDSPFDSSLQENAFGGPWNEMHEHLRHQAPLTTVPHDKGQHSAENAADGQTPHKRNKFISDLEDIDSILFDGVFERDKSFEDFERQFDKCKEDVRSTSMDSSDGAHHQFRPSRSGLRLDISKNRFIGDFRDIDEVLGKPSPLSPESDFLCGGRRSDVPLRLSSVGSNQYDDEDDGGSTTATSVLEAVDIGDMAWLEDIQDVPNDKHHSKINRQDSGYHNPEYDHILKGSIVHPAEDQLDDCTLQLYRYNGTEGDYGSYLDLESTIDEQTEEFEGFHENRKNAVILRTQLSVRVHAIIEKLVNSTGRELRRALFSLKQIFQDDKDLVHEFVQNDGLACLIKVGSEADQNYQNYILRALGQVMLYVDGMNGVIEHNETIQWLYSLISSKYRLVVKTALKLLLVFIEYTESNSQLLVNAVCVVDSEKGSLPWSNIMNLLKEKDSADMELLVYAVTLINKTLNGIPDQDTYYDVVDNLEEQGMEHVIQYYMSKQGTDLDLLQQFQIYETVLKHEDGVPDNKSLPLDSRFRQVPRSRKSYPDDNDRRKSRRYSAGTMLPTKQNKCLGRIALDKTSEESPFSWQNRNQNHIEDLNQKNSIQQNSLQINGNLDYETSDVNGITPALRRRRERDARNKSLIKEQEENGREAIYQRMDSVSSTSSVYSDNSENSPLVKEINSIVERHRSRFENHVENENRKNQELSKMKEDRLQPEDKNFLKQGTQPENSRPGSLPFARGDTNKKAWMFSMMYTKSQDDENKSVPQEQLNNCTSPVEIVNNNYIVFNKSRDEDTVKSNLRRDSSVKDMQEKFINKQCCDTNLRSPTSENLNRLGDTSGIISRAKEGLAASTTRPDLKTQTTITTCTSPMLEPKKPESDLQWEQLTKSIRRPLVINDLDFTDLRDDDDFDCLSSDSSTSSAQDHNQCNGRPSPPPLPPGTGPPPPPPPLPLGGGPVPPPPPPQIFNPQPSHFMSSKVPTATQAPPPPWVRRNQHHTQDSHLEASKTLQKTKKTVKLFWKEVKEDRSLLNRIGKKKTIWDELKPVHLDTQKLEHLFENRAKDVINKEKTQEGNKKNEIIVLDTKRSNAINIGMTKLPPPRTIKTAILKMDSTIMNREGIEKILTTMLPTEDEKARIAEAQMSSPDVPLGTAEQFLLTLSSISELEARLRLWAFRLDYDMMEREVAEPLMDLKQAMREIENSETFRVILSTLRSVGNFLNGIEIKGFHIEYLSKVPEVKDTVHKHSLLHHLSHIVMEKFPQSSDLYSEIGAVTRASKIDYAEVAKNLARMESECKASWDYLKAIAKHDGSITMKVRTSEFLTDCAERIIVLGVIHRRMVNRFHKFLVYLGFSSQSIEEMPIQKVCKVLSEFALEYRTTRERVHQQMEKKANHRERNKTRGKMITDMDKFRTKEQQADHELRQLLGNGNVNSDDQRLQKWGTVPGVRGRIKTVPGQGGSLGRHSVPAKEDNLTDADDEILETLVKTATTQSARNEPKIRKKARYGDRKSLRRTLKSGLSEEERNMLSTMTT